ncbi:GFA family protein [Allorhizobium undicola]|uniref:GFA family protein n=1 Tax=Allorhizobium undicola TaxID=78527 RepID=UPI0004844AB2|nr:GFA family protein [Allorhizobium undicola]
MSEAFTGGCQCGAVRFRAEKLGRPSICHCRMCQKQFGSFFAPLVSADQAHLTWTRGQPTLYRSSPKVKRGFCNKCGTPLTFQSDGGVELAIGAFDHPERIEPEIQVYHDKRLPYVDRLFDKPSLSTEVQQERWASIESWQHPDHDTDRWPPEDEA